MDFETVVSELYGLAPAEFTNARDALANEAKNSGDRELARAIGKLRRPSVSAWLANALVREHGDEVQSLLDLGAAIRQAQAQLAKDELRNLRTERRHAIALLLDAAAELARARGDSISSSVARDLEATLEAALLDPGAAISFKAGSLTSGLRYAGLGWPEGTDAISQSAGASDLEMLGRAEKSEPGLPPKDQTLRVAAAEAQREARAHLAEAEREADAAKRRVDEAARDRDVWRREVADLERQLGSVQLEAEKAQHRFVDAEEALAVAEQRLRAVRARLVEESTGLRG